MIKPNLIATTPLSKVDVSRWRDGTLSNTKDSVAEEVPIAMIYNGISHAVMLATPQDLEDFALGFSLSEGILQNKHELYDIEIFAQKNGIELKIEVASEAFANLKQHRRNLTGRTGCGLCGAESLQDALRLDSLQHSYRQLTHDSATEDIESTGLKYASSSFQATKHKSDSYAANKTSLQSKVNAASIQNAFRAMHNKQILQQATGATHACAWVNVDGDIQLLREDVGRHNAMDKLIGALAKKPVKNNGFVLTSSRASVEMVQKVALAGLHILAAISAPTGLAIRVAQQFDVTLVGFLRDNSFVIYCHPQRIIF